MKLKIGSKICITNQEPGDPYKQDDIAMIVSIDEATGVALANFNGQGNMEVLDDGMWYVSEDCVQVIDEGNLS